MAGWGLGMGMRMGESLRSSGGLGMRVESGFVWREGQRKGRGAVPSLMARVLRMFWHGDYRASCGRAFSLRRGSVGMGS